MLAHRNNSVSTSSVNTVSVNDDFKWCKTKQDIEYLYDSRCEGSLGVQGIEKEYFVLEKEQHLMSGKAYNCIKERITKTVKFHN